MKKHRLKILILSFVLTRSFSVFSQNQVPLINGDMEDTSPMKRSEYGKHPWIIKKMLVAPAKSKTFVEKNSGLAFGEGVDGSQAFKANIKNKNEGTNSSSTSLNFGWYDISEFGKGTYTFTFYVKAESMVKGRPFWIKVLASKGKGEVIPVKTSMKTLDRGGTVNFKEIHSGYKKQSITVEVTSDEAKQIRLAVQIGKYSNTYYFDNIALIHTK